MRIVLEIDADTVGGPRAVATIARGYLRVLTFQNRILIRRGLVPSLYGAFRQGEIEFRPEPNAGKFEEFADALTCARRGWLDCDDAVPWRCAEWMEAGRVAAPKIYWRMYDDAGAPIHDERRWKDAAKTVYHAECRVGCPCHNSLKCENSPVEDVSTFVGMARRGKFREGARA